MSKRRVVFKLGINYTWRQQFDDELRASLRNGSQRKRGHPESRGRFKQHRASIGSGSETDDSGSSSSHDDDDSDDSDDNEPSSKEPSTEGDHDEGSAQTPCISRAIATCIRNAWAIAAHDGKLDEASACLRYGYEAVERLHLPDHASRLSGHLARLYLRTGAWDLTQAMVSDQRSWAATPELKFVADAYQVLIDAAADAAKRGVPVALDSVAWPVPPREPQVDTATSLPEFDDALFLVDPNSRSFPLPIDASPLTHDTAAWILSGRLHRLAVQHPFSPHDLDAVLPHLAPTAQALRYLPIAPLVTAGRHGLNAAVRALNWSAAKSWTKGLFALMETRDGGSDAAPDADHETVLTIHRALTRGTMVDRARLLVGLEEPAAAARILETEMQQLAKADRVEAVLLLASVYAKQAQPTRVISLLDTLPTDLDPTDHLTALHLLVPALESTSHPRLVPTQAQLFHALHAAGDYAEAFPLATRLWRAARRDLDTWLHARPRDAYVSACRRRGRDPDARVVKRLDEAEDPLDVVFASRLGLDAVAAAPLLEVPYVDRVDLAHNLLAAWPVVGEPNVVVRVLDVSNNLLDGIALAACLAGLPSLEEVRFRYNHVKVLEASTVARLWMLRRVDLEGCRIREVVGDVVEPGADARLEMLNLSNNPIADEGVRRIVAVVPATLRHLYLARLPNCEWDNAMCDVLASRPGLLLDRLDLDFTRVTATTSLASVPAVRIDMSGSQLTNAHVPLLLATPCAELRVLRNAFSPAAVDELRAVNQVGGAGKFIDV
ncbi:hypothetical protein GGF31_001420 [Allomyces arbusculus]|nr:hypothetical protein GGF31_001420 [Allomyces arbusculus]